MLPRRCLCKITSSSITLWVRSSRRRNSPRINRFCGENTERGLAGDKCGWGCKKLITPRSHPSGSLPSTSLSISFVPPAVSSSFSHSFLSPASRPGADLWPRAVFSSRSEIAWICMSYRTIRGAWPRLSVNPTRRSAAFCLTCFQILFRVFRRRTVTGDSK